MRATIKDVSEQAGVSVGTVSNVLNAPSRVAPETRDRVLATIDRLGYRPNRAARALPSQRTSLIGYRMTATGDATLDVFLHSLVERAALDGLEVVLFAARRGQSEVEAYQEMIRRGDVDGFVVSETNYADPRIEFLTRVGFPFVSFGRAEVGAPFSWVDVDGSAGVARAVLHLVERGHRRIAFLGWPTGSEVGDDRYAGYRHGLDRAGIPLDSSLVMRAENHPSEGRGALRRLLELAGPPTAVVAVQDLLALGAVLEARAQGIRVGDDLAVVGFDDTPMASVTDPPLSSVRQPLREVGTLLVEELVRRMAEPGSSPSTFLVQPELVVRASSAQRLRPWRRGRATNK